jgi:hypothetical protein
VFNQWHSQQLKLYSDDDDELNEDSFPLDVDSWLTWDVGWLFTPTSPFEQTRQSSLSASSVMAAKPEKRKKGSTVRCSADQTGETRCYSMRFARPGGY